MNELGSLRVAWRLGDDEHETFEQRVNVVSRHDDRLPFISNRESRCDDCRENLGRRAMILLAGNRGALCLTCADLDHLTLLPSVDAALTRRARKSSTLAAVMLKWSQARKRYDAREHWSRNRRSSAPKPNV